MEENESDGEIIAENEKENKRILRISLNSSLYKYTIIFDF